DSGDRHQILYFQEFGVCPPNYRAIRNNPKSEVFLMRNRTLIWLLLGGGAFVLAAVTLLAVFLTFGGSDGTDFGFSDRVQVVDIEGELVESGFSLVQLK